MAVRGRKPKPTALKVLEGNPGHRPLNKKEPMPKGKLPRCPELLEEDAKKEWKRLGKVLAEMGINKKTHGRKLLRRLPLLFRELNFFKINA